MSAAVIGGLMGLGVQLYVNTVRKLPLFRNPWEHVLLVGAGAAFGNWIVDFEERTAEDVRGEAARGWRRGPGVTEDGRQVVQALVVGQWEGGPFND